MRLLVSFTVWMLIASQNLFAHDEGVVVDMHRPALVDCKLSPRNNNSEATQFVRAHFDQLYEKSKELLRHFAPQRDSFCVNVDYTPGRLSPNAYSTAETGEIVLTPSYLKLFATENQLAGTLAHELAHVAMNHSQSEPIPFFLRARATPKGIERLRQVYQLKEKQNEVRQNRQASFNFIDLAAIVEKDANTERRLKNKMIVEKYQSYEDIPFAAKNINTHPIISDDLIYSQFVQMAHNYNVAMDAAFLEFHQKCIDLGTQIHSLDLLLQDEFGPSYNNKIFTNFREQEADEVGLEFYVRAGYEPDGYLDSMLGLVLLGEPSLKSLKQAREFCLAQSRLELVARSKDSHPHSCWRVINIMRELKIHKKYYEELHLKAGPRPQIHFSLQSVQEKLK